uniref:Transcriptional coactivator p15 (PC4) C-terminal domain-containing protein n=1 Tax=Anopheles christyi TaxID=43041 RepID=A0A182JQS8_9DIPT
MATSNVKLPDLINRWIEVQKKGTELERAKPLDIDAINLTLLLKSMGLRLQYLDFEAEKSNADNLTITVKCNRSGMRAELSYELLRCSCPEKTDRDSSFWEVQGTGPKVFSKCKNNASSNLLPDLSESCALVSKAMLSNLLDYYEASIRQVKEGKEQAMLHSPLKSPRPKVSVVSPGLTIKKPPFSTPPAEGKFSSRIESAAPVGALDDTVEDNIETKQEASPNNMEKDEQIPGLSCDRQSGEGQIEPKSNVSSESVGINNKTHDLLNTDHPANKPIVDAVLSPAQTSVADDNAYEAMKTLVTSSPNERPVDATAGTQQDRDQNVISYLQDARCQIDMALLLMKLNSTQDNTNGFGCTITPQHASATSRKSFVTTTPKFIQPRSSSLLSIDRRRTPSDIGVPKKTSSTSSLPSSAPRLSIGSSAGRVDTPRPTVAQVKSVAALRKPVGMPRGSISGTPTAALQSTIGGLKKPPSGSIASLSSQRKPLTVGGGTPAPGGRSIPKPPTLSGRKPAGRTPAKKAKSTEKTPSTPAKDPNVFELDKNRKITVNEFKGKVYVGIREFYNKDGQDMPSKKGISLTVPQWKTLLEHADAINEQIKKF